MARYVDLCRKNLKIFYTPVVYGSKEEFGSKDLFSGSTMPLSSICTNLKVKHTIYSGGQESWEDFYGKEEADYSMNNLGKIIYADLKQSAHLHKMERTRIGSIGINIYAMNERRRQLQRFQRYKNDGFRHAGASDIDLMRKSSTYKGLQLFRKFCLENIDIDIELYTWYLKEIRRQIQIRLDDKSKDLIKDTISHYISEQNKKKTSIMPRLNLSYPYLVKREQPLQIAQQHVDIIDETLKDLYSMRRINPKIFLNPLRQRPSDYSLIKETSAYSRMSRSRKPLGVPQLSHIKMTIYDIKDEIDIALTKKMHTLWRLSEQDFFTPYTDEDFLYNYYNRKKGVYIFGDNGCVVKNSFDKLAYDVSMSEAVTAYATRDNLGKNFCFFVRLNNQYDTGASGDPLTWAWNINNQFKLWRAYKNGILQGEHFPEIPEIIDHSDLFLGIWLNPETNRSRNIGLRLTKDKAADMQGYQFKMGDNIIEWPIQHEIEDTSIMQTIITSGVSDISLEAFYNWAYKKGLKDDMNSLEDYSLPEIIERMLKKTEDRKSFFELFDGIDLEYLADPMSIIWTEVKEDDNPKRNKRESNNN